MTMTAFSTSCENVSRRNRFSVKFFGLLLLFVMMSVSEGWGQVSITSLSNTYSQNFDGLASTTGTGITWTNNSTLTGWYLFTGANNAITTYSAETGSTGTANYCSYGASGNSERALGSTGSGGIYWGSPSGGNVAGYMSLALTNATGSTVNSVTISFDGEQWRKENNASAQTMLFQYGFGSTFSTVSTWTNAGSTFNFTSPVTGATTAAAVVGNVAGRVSNLGGTISSLGWSNGSILWLRWVETNDAGNDHSLAIDNFSFSAITTSSISDIIRNTSFTEPTNITYGSYQSANIINDANDIEVAKFDIRDGGGTTDGDALGTILTDISFTVANWANIRKLAIYDGSTEISEVAVSSGTVAFTGLTGLTAADGSSKSFSLRASFNAIVTDNQQLQFTVASATASVLGSTFATGAAGGAASSITGSANKVAVSATKILFVQQPTGVAINSAISPAPTVKACDANNNIDLDYVTPITIISSGTLTGSPVTGVLTNGLATFSSLIHTDLGTGITLTASSSGFTDITSSAFDVASACATLPTVNTTLAANTIATTTASSGGQTLGVDAGCAITNKGVCWDIASSPTIAGSKTDNGTGSLDFTSSITGLTAGTLYYLRAYATNSFGTAYGDEKTFRTLSLEPTTQQPASFTSTIISSSQIDLAFSAASTITNGGGYIILQKSGSAATGLPTDGTGYVVGATIGDATVAAVVNSSATTTSITGLSGNTTYYFSIIPLNWDGSNTTTYNYKTSATVLTTNKTTLKIEPTNQATNFAVGTVTTANIPLTWTAAVAGSQSPDGYLIKLSTSSVVDPVDGTSPSDALNVSGGSGNKNTTGTLYSSFTNWTAGTMYNFKIYSYSNSSTNINFNTTAVPTLSHATLPAAVTGTSVIASGTTSANVTWTLPGSYVAGNHSTLVFIKSGSTVTTGTPTNAPSTYTANTAFASGTAYQGDAAAYCVYNGDGTNVSVTGLSANTTYYALIYTVVDASNSNATNSYSATSTPSGATLKIEPTNQATAFSVGNVTTSAIPLTWNAAVAGSQAPDGYLIKLNTSTVVDPVDGTDPSNITSITSGAANKTATGTSATSFTNMTAGTMYNYKIYSYTNSGTNINFNTTSAPSLNHATLPAVVTATSFTATGTTTANIAWTLPASYSAGNHSTLVFIKSGSTVTTGTPTNAPSTYTANTAFASGTAYQGDAAAYCVYNGDGTNVSVTGLSASTTYYVLIYTVVDASNSNSTNSYSAVASSNGITQCSEINSFPYTESFSASLGCWTATEEVVGSTYHWTTTTADATNGVASPQSGTNFAFLDVYNAAIANNPYYLKSPTFVLDATPKQVRYYYWMGTQGNQSSPIPLTLQISDNNGATWTDIYQHTSSNSIFGTASNSPWTQNVVDLTSYINKTVIFRFASNSNYGSGYCNQALDEFIVENAILPPVANQASGTNSTSFTANWGSSTNAISYKLDVSSYNTFNTTGILTINEGFSGGVNSPIGWTFTNIASGSTYTSNGNYGASSPSLKLDASNDRIQTPILSGSASQLSFWLKSQSANGSYLLVEGYNGSSWSAIENILLTSLTTGTVKTYNSGSSPSLASNFTQFRFTYTQNSGNLSFDDISITYTGAIPSFVGTFNNLTASSGTTVSNLSPNTTYYYRVRAVGSNSTSANSNVVTVLTFPAAPVAVAASAVNALNFVANWTLPATGADSYTLDVATDEDFNNKLEAYNNLTVTGTSQVITGLNRNSTYYYRVKSQNTSGASVSNVISVSTGNAITVTGSNESAGSLADCVDCDLVVNQGGHLTVNANKSFNSVTIKPGAKLTLNNGQTFAPGTFVLESDATGTATFVDKRTHANKTNITATVQQHLPAATTRTWWYLASPVNGASYTVFGSNKVGEYNETTRSYSSPFAEPTALVAGKGYVVKMTAASAANYIFENKTLNTGNISVPLTRTVTETSDNAKRGFNLVGNPYPSYLNWELVYNASANIRPSIWYRTLDGGSMVFHTYNATLGASVPSSASGYIPPMQAFWVKVNADPVSPATVSNGTLNMTNDMRSHEGVTANPLKAPAVERPLVRLVISNGSASDETVIVAHTAALDGYDSFDSEKMANDNINKPEIYSIAGTQELVISGVSPLSVDKQLALGVRPGKSGDYSISVGELKGIPSDLKVVLKDKHTGAFTELTAGTAYSFNTDGNTVNDRFSLLFRAKDISTDIDNGKYLDLQVYGQNGQIVLRSAKLTGAEILVFNALGQPLYAQQSEGTTCTVRGNFTPGVYLVKVNNEVRKVTLK